MYKLNIYIDKRVYDKIKNIVDAIQKQYLVNIILNPNFDEIYKKGICKRDVLISESSSELYMWDQKIGKSIAFGETALKWKGLCVLDDENIELKLKKIMHLY